MHDRESQILPASRQKARFNPLDLANSSGRADLMLYLNVIALFYDIDFRQIVSFQHNSSD